MPYICHICLKSFTRSNRLQSHLNKKKPCQPPLDANPSTEKIKVSLKKPEITLKEEIILLKEQLAEQNQQLTRLANAPLPSKTLEILEEIKQQVSHNNKQIAKLKEKPIINNQNILQVVCIGVNDNYLDMLTQQWGDFDKALEYIKDCALSELTGDCKLIEKIYLNDDQGNQTGNIYYLDKNRTKIVYFNEKKEKIQDSKDLFSRKIANNLQNSYLKGVNHLINQNLDCRGCPNKFLEEYDLQLWNQHIYDLSDQRYQRKVVNQLKIPIVS